MFPLFALCGAWLTYFAFLVVRHLLQRRNVVRYGATDTTAQRHNGNVADVVATAHEEDTERGSTWHDDAPLFDEETNTFEWIIKE